MTYCTCQRTAGRFSVGYIVAIARRSAPPVDPETEVAIEVDHEPDRVAERWDGADGLRPATAQEMADHDDTVDDETATDSLNTPLNKVLRDLYWDIEERLRMAGQTSSLTDIAAAGTKGAYTGALKDRVKALL